MELPEGVTLERLIQVYNNYVAHNKKRTEKLHEYYQTEEGKKKNRERAKRYYEANREKILLKKKQNKPETN